MFRGTYIAVVYRLYFDSKTSHIARRIDGCKRSFRAGALRLSVATLRTEFSESGQIHPEPAVSSEIFESLVRVFREQPSYLEGVCRIPKTLRVGFVIIKRGRNPVINCDMSTFSKFLFRQVKIWCEYLNKSPVDRVVNLNHSRIHKTIQKFGKLKSVHPFRSSVTCTRPKEFKTYSVLAYVHCSTPLRRVVCAPKLSPAPKTF